MKSTQQITISALLSLAMMLGMTSGFSVISTAATRATNNHQSIMLPGKNHYRTSKQSQSILSRPRTSSYNKLHLSATDNTNNNSSDAEQPKKTKGDSIRSTTGIRPSLHPTEINCIAEALMLRSTQNPSIDIDITQSSEPLQVAITAGGIAMSAIDKRNSDKDDTSEKFTLEESQVISGRVVGVVMRMKELEEELVKRVGSVGWVGKYGEEESFGVLREECRGDDDDDGARKEVEKKVGEAIKMNPLFRMNRAECLLGLFLDMVERPKLEMIGEDVVGGSEVDFIDADRLEVLRTNVGGEGEGDED